MTDYDRNMGNENNDWDWYYYEYRYLPDPSDRYVYDQNMSGRGNNYRYGEYNNWNRGPYSGVGPRGYSRSDDRIREDINDRLTWHDQIDASDIQVDVNDGLVSLTGSVNSRWEKRMAENIADNVSGVQDVDNKLSVNKNNRNNQVWGRSGTSMRNQIREGMDVVGRDGQNIGQVKEVRSYDLLVDRSMARDIYIPFNACRSTDGQIQLYIRADEVDDQDWPAPDLLGASEATTAGKNKR